MEERCSAEHYHTLTLQSSAVHRTTANEPEPLLIEFLTPSSLSRGRARVSVAVPEPRDKRLTT